jgi:hypothetical protein
MLAGQAGIVGAAAAAVPDFGSQNHRLPFVFDGFPDNFLRLAESVGVRRVEHVDALFKG